MLHKEIWQYCILKHVRRNYETEFQSWIENGWLLFFLEEKLGFPNGCDPTQQKQSAFHEGLLGAQLACHCSYV